VKLLFLIALLLWNRSASATDVLPYFTRTRGYSGWGTSVRGDIRTVGMAGATIGLGDTLIASFDQPAGLAMTLTDIDFNVTSNSIHDAQIQTYSDPVMSNNFGVALSHYPWGFSLGYISPYREADSYSIGEASADPHWYQITTRELRFSLARLFFNDKLSLGASFSYGQTEDEIDSIAPDDAISNAYHAYSAGFTFGGLLQLPKHFLLGLSLHLPQTFGVDTAANPSPILPGFYQSVTVPARLGFGLGWMPNRFFRGDMNLVFVGTSSNTALLRDDSAMIGQKMTVQPHLGVAYVFAEFKEVKATAYTGVYYETSRIDSEPDRVHFTLGTEAKVWVFGLGLGVDMASSYQNNFFAITVDVFKLMAKVGLIPWPVRSSYGGWLPQVDKYSDDGLPRPLVQNWKPGQHAVDAIKAGLDLPDAIQKKVKSTTDMGIGGMGEGVINTIQSIPGAVSKELDDMNDIEEKKDAPPPK
jgi:hypothetical protein